MSPRPLRALCLAALLALAGFAHAEIDRPAAESLVHKSGLWEQLAGVGPQVQDGMRQALEQAGFTASESEQARVARVIAHAYAPDRLRAISTGVIAAKTQPQHLDALRRWFDSAQGQAVTRAEEASAANQADPAAAMKDGLALLETMPAQRRKLLEDLLAATHAADALVQMTISTAVAVQLGAASAMAGAPAASATDIRAAMEAQRPQMLQAFTAVTLASFAVTYAKLPSTQLRHYVAFVRTPAGAAFNQASLDALDAALTNAASEMGRSLPGTRDGSNT